MGIGTGRRTVTEPAVVAEILRRVAQAETTLLETERLRLFFAAYTVLVLVVGLVAAVVSA